MGHVYETLTLASMLRDDHQIHFFLPGDETSISLVDSHGYAVTKSSQAPSLSETISDFDPDVLVLDLPTLTASSLETLASEIDGRIVVFGNPEVNLPDRPEQWADVVVNYTTGLDRLDSEQVKHGDGTMILRGLRYFVLREEFQDRKLTTNTSNGSLINALVMYGGSDPAELTSETIQNLDFENTAATVVIGPNNNQGEVVDRIANDNDRIEVKRETDEVAELMTRADVVLTSPGGTSFEALSLGVPTIAFYQNDFQRDAYRDVPFAYEPHHIQKIDELIRETVRSWDNRYSMDVGEGLPEVIAAIEGVNCEE
jgi:spore coat polysaccharide biosynthesis predicted glycosyltransferase SpsG